MKMGHIPDEPASTILTKIVIYAGGVMAGLAAKLAMVNKEKNLTIKEVLFHSSVAFACAWAVWNIISYYGKPELANVVSVIVGRFADNILMIIWDALKIAFNANPVRRKK